MLMFRNYMSAFMLCPFLLACGESPEEIITSCIQDNEYIIYENIVINKYIDVEGKGYFAYEATVDQVNKKMAMHSLIGI